MQTPGQSIVQAPVRQRFFAVLAAVRNRAPAQCDRFVNYEKLRLRIRGTPLYPPSAAPWDLPNRKAAFR